ncbi:MAG: hypothetical protein FWG55_06930 [Candidatus Bathyarchaeota archaeon]|nr:hypothetical protein [Candidatus Termiticorpusculum sp.]
MGAFVFQESSTSPEAKTELKTVVNVPLMKKKSNIETKNLFILIPLASFSAS